MPNIHIPKEADSCIFAELCELIDHVLHHIIELSELASAVCSLSSSGMSYIDRIRDLEPAVKGNSLRSTAVVI